MNYLRLAFAGGEVEIQERAGDKFSKMAKKNSALTWKGETWYFHPHNCLEYPHGASERRWNNNNTAS